MEASEESGARAWAARRRGAGPGTAPRGVRSGLGCVLLGVLVVFLGAGLGRAAAGRVLLSAGPHTLSLTEAQARFDRLGPHGSLALGHDEAQRRRRFVDEHLTPWLLMKVAAAEASGPGDARRAELRDGVLSRALERDLFARSEATRAAAHAYYQAHSREFMRPQALLLWRILVDTKAEAQAILAELQGAPLTEERWARLARDASKDDATRYRYGRLGYVAADGRTDVAQVRVGTGVYRAAKSVPDDALVARPVADGSRFSVVWRRGSRAREVRAFESVQGEVADRLRRRQAADELASLLGRLRQLHVGDVDEAALETVEYAAPALPPYPARALAPRAAAGAPAPRVGGPVLR